MIRINDRKVAAIYYNGKSILSVFIRGNKVWPEELIDEILSCYFNGYWIDEYPWTDDTPWTD